MNLYLQRTLIPSTSTPSIDLCLLKNYESWLQYDLVYDWSLISYSRHLLMKSRKLASQVLTACWRSFDPTRLFLPLLFVIHLGLPLESVKTKHNCKQKHDKYENIKISWNEAISYYFVIKICKVLLRFTIVNIYHDMNQSKNVFCICFRCKHPLICENKLTQPSVQQVNDEVKLL